MRNAVQNSEDINIKSEISSIAQLVNSLPNQSISISSILSRFNLSDHTKEAIYNELPNHNCAKEKFVFSSSEFERHIHYRSIELDNGGIVVADAQQFSNVFEITENINDGVVAISTKGKIIDEKLRKTK